MNSWAVPRATALVCFGAALATIVTFHSLPVGASAPHNTIDISGDSGFSAANGVSSGSGTPSDPYIIEDWIFNGTRYGINIADTHASVVIRNIELNGTSKGLAFAIYLVRASNVVIQNVSVAGSAQRLSFGIGFMHASNVSIQNVSITGGFGGLTIQDSQGIDLNDVSVSSTETSIFIANSTAVSLRSAHLGSSSTGCILLNRTSDSTFEANILDGCGQGILAFHSAGLTIRSNRFSNVSNWVISATDVQSTLIDNNWVDSPGGALIGLFGCRNVRITHNFFVGGGRHTIDDAPGLNQWDGGYPDGGNFWVDHAGGDSCGGPNQDVCPFLDGFADSPKTIDENVQDRYPLSESSVSSAHPVPLENIGIATLLGWKALVPLVCVMVVAVLYLKRRRRTPPQLGAATEAASDLDGQPSSGPADSAEHP